MNIKQWALDKLTKRLESINKQGERVKIFIQSNQFSGSADRIWLDQFVRGNGLDICCGNFQNPDAAGVDPDLGIIPADYFMISGDELTQVPNESLDFIITNYFECFPNPLKALHDWHRALKPGATLAMVIRDADAYSDTKDPHGALTNIRRVNTFNISTICHYVRRAGFKTKFIEKFEGTIRIKTVRK